MKFKRVFNISMIVLILFITADHAECDIYRWVDSMGVVHFSDGEVPDHEDKEVFQEVSYEPEPSVKKPSYNKVDRTPVRTSVRIRDNQIIVPVLLKNSGNRVRANLLLDTGASSTMIYSSVAKELGLDNVREGAARVAGGGYVRMASSVIDSLSVDKKTIRFPEIAIMSHYGPYEGFDGLLGMDFLRRHNYTIDYNRHAIEWK